MVVSKNVAGGVRDDQLTLDGEAWRPSCPGVGGGRAGLCLVPLGPLHP